MNALIRSMAGAILFVVVSTTVFSEAATTEMLDVKAILARALVRQIKPENQWRETTTLTRYQEKQVVRESFKILQSRALARRCDSKFYSKTGKPLSTEIKIEDAEGWWVVIGADAVLMPKYFDASEYERIQRFAEKTLAKPQAFVVKRSEKDQKWLGREERGAQH